MNVNHVYGYSAVRNLELEEMMTKPKKVLEQLLDTLEGHRDRLERLKPSFRTKDGQTELRGRISAFETAIAEVNALILELE